MTWIKRKIGPAIHNITTLDDAERVLTSDSKLVLGYLNSLVVWFRLVPSNCFCVIFLIVCLVIWLWFWLSKLYNFNWDVNAFVKSFEHYDCHKLAAIVL